MRKTAYSVKSLVKPNVIKINWGKSPLEVFTALCERYEYAYLLESVEGPEKIAEYSFVGFDPTSVISIKNGRGEVYDRVEGKGSRCVVSDPLFLVREVVSRRYKASNDFRFIGGAVGYLSYDVIRYWENLPEYAVDDSNLSDLEVGIYDDGIVFDHKTSEAFYYHFGQNRLKEVEEALKEKFSPEFPSYLDPKSNVEKEEFEEIVRKSKEYIFSGDAFQIVLSRRFEFSIHGSLIPFYNVLRNINPSPYMYFLKMKRCKIVG